MEICLLHLVILILDGHLVGKKIQWARLSLLMQVYLSST